MLTTEDRLLPISILRLLSYSNASQNRDPLFVFIWPEIWLEIEMCYSIISATLPCLRIFLEAASANRMGANIIDPTETQLATAGDYSGSYVLSTLNNRNRGKGKDKGDQVQLTGQGYGENMTSAVRGGAEDKISIASDSSRKAIMVRQTVMVQHGDSE